MESVVKNCGQTVHDEVANKQTMEELKELLKVPSGGREVQQGQSGFRMLAGTCGRSGAGQGGGQEGWCWESLHCVQAAAQSGWVLPE